MAHQKLFTKSGVRLHVFAGVAEHEWELRGSDQKTYFTGRAEELDKHIEEKTATGEYGHTSKRGRRKSELY